jgi:hypothetical protein
MTRVTVRRVRAVKPAGRRRRRLSPDETAKFFRKLASEIGVDTGGISRATGLSKRTIQRLRSGKQRTLRRKLVVDVAARMGWPVEHLLGHPAMPDEDVLRGWVGVVVASEAERAACDLAIAVSSYAKSMFSLACDYFVQHSAIDGRPVQVSVIVKPIGSLPRRITIREDQMQRCLKFVITAAASSALNAEAQFRLTKANLHNALRCIASDAKIKTNKNNA